MQCNFVMVYLMRLWENYAQSGSKPKLKSAWALPGGALYSVFQPEPPLHMHGCRLATKAWRLLITFSCSPPAWKIDGKIRRMTAKLRPNILFSGSLCMCVYSSDSWACHALFYLRSSGSAEIVCFKRTGLNHITAQGVEHVENQLLWLKDI